MVGNERLKAFPLPLEIPPTMLAKLEKMRTNKIITSKYD
jgi:hypothetical protein